MAKFGNMTFSEYQDRQAARAEENRYWNCYNIDTLTEEQHGALSSASAFRHKLHICKRSIFYNMDGYYDELNSEHIQLKQDLIAEGLITEAEMKTTEDIDELETPYMEDWYQGLICEDVENEEERLKFLNICEDFWGDWVSCRVQEIKNILVKIDKNHGTQYAPTGKLAELKFKA